jgi:hypothetical protein
METNIYDFLLYKKIPSHIAGATSSSFDIKSYVEDDFVLDMYLSHTGAYRGDGKVIFHNPKTGEEFWDFLRDLRAFLTKHYTFSFLFSTGNTNSLLIELTPEIVG